MVYPNLEKKYLWEPLFTAEDFTQFGQGNSTLKFPKRWIITFQKHAEKFIKRKFKLKKYTKHSLGGNVYLTKKVGFLKIRGIGSPHACTCLEELIALGGKEFVIVGTAGGLRERGLFLCDKAIRDEGTSSHYLKHTKYSYPNKNLTHNLKKFLDSKRLKVNFGTSWTIDAPYRETKKEIEHYKKEGVSTVEMEASAMFAVSKLRKVSMAAIFSVSDLVGGEKWKPEFDKKSFKIAFHKALVYTYEFFSKKSKA